MASYGGGRVAGSGESTMGIGFSEAGSPECHEPVCPVSVPNLNLRVSPGWRMERDSDLIGSRPEPEITERLFIRTLQEGDEGPDEDDIPQPHERLECGDEIPEPGEEGAADVGSGELLYRELLNPAETLPEVAGRELPLSLSLPESEIHEGSQSLGDRWRQELLRIAWGDSITETASPELIIEGRTEPTVGAENPSPLPEIRDVVRLYDPVDEVWDGTKSRDRARPDAGNEVPHTHASTPHPAAHERPSQERSRNQPVPAAEQLTVPAAEQAREPWRQPEDPLSEKTLTPQNTQVTEVARPEPDDHSEIKSAKAAKERPSRAEAGDIAAEQAESLGLETADPVKTERKTSEVSRPALVAATRQALETVGRPVGRQPADVPPAPWSWLAAADESTHARAMPAEHGRAFAQAPEGRELERQIRLERGSESCDEYAALATLVDGIQRALACVLEKLGAPAVVANAVAWLANRAAEALVPPIATMHWVADAVRVAHALGCERGLKCGCIRSLALEAAGAEAKQVGAEKALEDGAARVMKRLGPAPV